MATSHTPNSPRRRWLGDRAATGAATPPGADTTAEQNATEQNAPEHSTGHPNARGTLPMANPTSTPTTGGQPPSSTEDDAKATRRHRTGAALRDVADPAIDAALDALVDAAPPLPHEARARLAWLLRGQHHQPSRNNTAA